jgi:drug/metabolite transporter (DMT)-like permease
MASLLYLGSGLGVTVYRLARRAPAVKLAAGEWPWFVGAVIAGGVIGPVLQMLGLTGMPASGASLLLNAESVFTAGLAWFVFRENFDKRVALGMLAIVAGLLILSWPGQTRFAGVWPALCVLGACLSWAVDNNLTRKVSLTDATWITAWKGLIAGSVNLILAFVLRAKWPSSVHVAEAMLVGTFAYGASLVLFVIGLRHLGTARTGAYYSVAPFFGAILSVLFLHERASNRLLVAGGLMAFGLWLHFTEEHRHEHTHPLTEHEHEHVHDEHHQHSHEFPVTPETRHTHPHRHEPITHTHSHYPDAHHQHEHE